MASWDIFHADRLELKRGLEADAVRAAFECGELRDDDLARPAGTSVAWSRLADMPELTEAAPGPIEPATVGPAHFPAAQQAAGAPAELSDYEVESDDFGPDLSDSPATLCGT